MEEKKSFDVLTLGEILLRLSPPDNERLVRGDLLRKQTAWIALLPVVVVNGLIVGWVLNAAYGAPLLLSMCTVALGQAVVCYVLGLPLLHLFRKRIPEKYYK